MKDYSRLKASEDGRPQPLLRAVTAPETETHTVSGNDTTGLAAAINQLQDRFQEMAATVMAIEETTPEQT